MTAITPLDPDSPEGRQVAADLTDLCARVRLRLRREGRPLPDRRDDVPDDQCGTRWGRERRAA